MAAGYNRVILVGNLTRDPDHKQLPSGQNVCRLGLASNRQFRNRQSGDMVQEVCYVDIDVWGPQAESCNQYLKKGRAVLVEGRLKFDTWQDQEGQTRSKHSIVADRVVFLSSPSSESEQGFGGATVGARQDTPVDPATRQAMDRLDAVRTTAAKQTSTDAATDPGTVPLKDDPPFQDDLPF